jgi:hypothetical protein
MSRRPKKRCAVCGQDIVPDPLVDPGNPPHRHQACTTAHPTRAHHRMVTLAKSSPSRSTPRPSQNKNATVMLGYVPVSNEGRFEVGRRLKEDFENGRHYYAMQGQSILMPSHPEQRPKREALEWHQTNRFLG